MTTLGKTYLAMEMDNRRTAEQLRDIDLDHLKSQTLRIKSQGRLMMEWMIGVLPDLVHDTRLTSPNGPKGQNFGNYKLKFKRNFEEFLDSSDPQVLEL